jgi:hypothetical protein
VVCCRLDVVQATVCFLCWRSTPSRTCMPVTSHQGQLSWCRHTRHMQRQVRQHELLAIVNQAMR